MQANLAKSVQRLKVAVDEAKVRLNSVYPGAWLMPEHMVINNGGLQESAPASYTGH